MKPFTYQLSSSDCSSLYFILSATSELLPFLPSDEYDSSFISKQKEYSISAAKVLENQSTRISLNQLQAIYNALIIADEIVHKDIFLSDDLYKSFTPYIFAVEKLLPIFDDYFVS